MYELCITHFIGEMRILSTLCAETVVIASTDSVQEHFVGKRLIIENRDFLVECLIRKVVLFADFIA